MHMKRRTKVEQAEEAIDAVFSDISVPQKMTQEQLRELRDAIDIKLRCIEIDLKRAAREGRGND